MENKVNNNLFIIGDSWGDPCYHITSQYHHIKSIHNYLEESGEFDDIVNRAKSGSSVWKQYTEFLRRYNGQQYVLLFDTQPWRFSFTDEREAWTHNEFCNADIVERTIKREKLTTEQRKTFKALIGYFEYLTRSDFDFTTAKLMTEDIIRKVEERGGKIIILPIDTSSTSCKDNKCLNDIYHMENDTWNKAGFDTDNRGLFKKNLDDIRANHMTNENNEILAKQIINMFKGDQTEVDYSAFVQPNSEDFHNYFVKTESIGTFIYD